MKHFKNFFIASFVSVLFVSAPQKAKAAYSNTYLIINCMASLNYFSLHGIDIDDENNVSEQSSDTSDFIVFESLIKKPYFCKLKNHTAKISLNYSPAGKPPYNYDSGILSIYWDDKLIENIGIHNNEGTDFIISLYQTEFPPYKNQNILVGYVCDLNTLPSRGCLSFNYDKIPVTFLNQY